MRPGYAVVVVSVVAIAVVGIVLIAVRQLDTGTGANPAADPNAATITAIAPTAIAAIVSLTEAHFRIKVASENAAQATSTDALALEVASKVSANSTTNANPQRLATSDPHGVVGDAAYWCRAGDGVLRRRYRLGRTLSG